MQKFIWIFMICVASLVRPAVAANISPNASVGPVPATAATGLFGAYYKLPTSYLTSVAQAQQLIALQAGPTATFTAGNICYPNCTGSTVIDSTSTLAAFLGSNVQNFSYTVPAWQIPSNLSDSAIVLSGYIAITQAGTYNFNLGSDDGSMLTIGDQVVVNNDGVHPFEVANGNAVFAAAGLYKINVTYFENAGNTGLEMWATDNAGNCILGGASNCLATPATNLVYLTAPVATPEPGTVTLFAAGLFGLVFVRRHLPARSNEAA